MMLYSTRSTYPQFISVFILLLPTLALAATTGGEFQAFYDFIYDAATGYLGRGLAITGGAIQHALG